MDDIAIFLAKFWGWYLVIFFLILSYNPGRIKQISKDLKNSRFSVVVGFIAIIIGLLNILFYNEWVYDWTMIITLIGWIALGKGMLIFTFPSQAAKMVNYINVRWIILVYVLILLLGLNLLNNGYDIISYLKVVMYTVD